MMIMDEEKRIKAARTRKALALVAIAREAGITDSIVPQLTELQWRMMAQLACVSIPSDTTKAMVADMLQHGAAVSIVSNKAKEVLARDTGRPVQGAMKERNACDKTSGEVGSERDQTNRVRCASDGNRRSGAKTDQVSKGKKTKGKRK